MEPNQVAIAANHLEGIVNKTPVIQSRTLNTLTGRKIFLKCENFQRVGAFKFRGAFNAISQLSEEERTNGVITHSSGNHAQGVALASKLLGIEATIVMPFDSPTIKKKATAGYGAKIVFCQAAKREEVTADLIKKHGYTLISPFDNELVIAGQGTSAWELFQEVGELDILFVPVGGGGLISGCALAASLKSPNCHVVGVEPELADDAFRSWQQNKIVHLKEVPPTIADGLRPLHIGQRNLKIMRQYVDEMVTVDEVSIVETLKFLWERLKIIVEPSSAVALAPVFTQQYHRLGQRVGIILSGGNVDLAQMSEIFSQSSSEKIVDKLEKVNQKTSHHLPNVLALSQLDQEDIQTLERVASVEVRLDMTPDSLHGVIGDYEALVVGSEPLIPGQVIEYGHQLRAIALTGNRLDNIDVSAAQASGVEILYQPDGRAVAVAEHTFNLMLSMIGRSQKGDKEKNRESLAGKTLGIVGFGQIGLLVAERAQAFGMRVLVNQPRLTPELALAENIEKTDLVDLLQSADFVTLHLPHKENAPPFIGAEELNLMKSSAFIINTAHTDLLDHKALLNALNENRIAGAALASYSPPGERDELHPPSSLRKHPKVISAQHITSFSINPDQMDSKSVIGKLVALLKTIAPADTLSLTVVPVDQVQPHEKTDDKRVTRLMKRLEKDGCLVNPPIVSQWKNQYIILDGATRFTALKNLGYPHMIVQVVSSEREQFVLHTWYHVISSYKPVSELYKELKKIDGLHLSNIGEDKIQDVFRESNAICYFMDRNGQYLQVENAGKADWLDLMNKMVKTYTNWGTVERTLLTDGERLKSQFPNMVSLAVFPQFASSNVFDIAVKGNFMPAGLTRFVIPGRILRLNADLGYLKSDKPLAQKRIWLNQLVQDKLARSRLRYYQEPVVLLDE